MNLDDLTGDGHTEFNIFGSILKQDGGTLLVNNLGLNGDSGVQITPGDPTPFVSNTVAVGNLPTEVAVNPDGSQAYVSNLNFDTVSVIDTVTNSVIDTIAVGEQTSRDRVFSRWHSCVCCEQH